jgi:hypothetical protein
MPYKVAVECWAKLPVAGVNRTDVIAELDDHRPAAIALVDVNAEPEFASVALSADMDLLLLLV